MQKWHTDNLNRENRDQPVDLGVPDFQINSDNPKPSKAVWSETDFWDLGHTIVHPHFLGHVCISLACSICSQIHILSFFLRFSVLSCKISFACIVPIFWLRISPIFLLISPYLVIQITTLGYASWLLRLHRSLSTGFVSTYGNRKCSGSSFSQSNPYLLMLPISFEMIWWFRIFDWKWPPFFRFFSQFSHDGRWLSCKPMGFADVAGVVVAEAGGLQTSAALASAIMQDAAPTVGRRMFEIRVLRSKA